MNDIIQNAYKMADTINKLGSQYEKLEASIDKVNRGQLALKVDDYYYNMDQIDVNEKQVKEKIIENLEKQKEDALEGVQALTESQTKDDIIDEVKRELYKKLEKQFNCYLDNNPGLKPEDIKEKDLFIGIMDKSNICYKQNDTKTELDPGELVVDEQKVKSGIIQGPKETEDKPIPRRGHASVDDLDLEEVKAYYLQDGVNQKSAAAHFNVGQNAFAKYLKENGITKGIKKQVEVQQEKKELDDEKVVDLICKQGKTVTDAAAILGTDKKTLYDYCKDHYISFPRKEK